MNTTREAIYSALFALVSGATVSGGAAFPITKSRRYRPWSEVPPESQPAIFQVQRRETPTTDTQMPAKWKLEVDIVIYVNSTGDADVTASTLMNPILDAVTKLFDADQYPGANRQTLGGLVHFARISGAIETDEGVLGAQMFAIIPIEIFTI